MAANKFATLLHRNTHRVVVVLVYTLLEWILIALLLLNALFSYLISKFAAYFGLPPPCIFCSRVDHLLEGRGGGEPSIAHRGLICDAHAAEVSRLGYCSHHRRLAEAGGMCDGCSSSLPSPSNRCRQQTVALLSVVEKEEGEEASRCSCCGVVLESSDFYSPYLFFKPSWGVLGYKDEILREKEGYKDEIFKEKDAGLVDEAKVLPPVSADDVRVDEDDDGDEHIAVEGNEEEDDTSPPLEDPAAPIGQSEDPFCNREEGDESLEILNKGRHFEWDGRIERLLPVDLIDSTTLKCLEKLSRNGEEGELGHREGVIKGATADIGTVSVDEDIEAQKEVVSPLIKNVETQVEVVSPLIKTIEAQEELVSPLIKTGEAQEEVVCPQIEIVEVQEEVVSPQIEIAEEVQEEVVSSLVPEETDCAWESSSVTSVAEEEQGALQDPLKIPTIVPHDGTCEVEAAVVDGEEKQASEEDNKMMDGETNCEVSIGSEICDQEQIDQGDLHDELPPLIDLHDYSSDNPNDVPDENQATIVEVEPIQTMDRELGNHLSISSEQTEAEERPPETPSSVEGLHNLHKRFLFERRESGTESVDGSVASEVDSSDILTVDHLKAALKAERKALSVLYTELEEERSASAISANQTMAMITRLQEEKAAMQMEALQYQRMMEEQSDYDQEALQLLNELMVKREKEKQDLEKELEVYRKKILLYEAKERRRLKKAKATGRSGTSSASSSAEDSDDLSFELNDSDENFDGVKESNQNTPTDTVLSTGQETAKHLVTVDESLADFEEERLSIIEQLKALEEKLFTMDDGEQCPQNLEVREHFPEENGDLHERDIEFHDGDINGYENGFMEDLNTNGKHHHESNSLNFHGKRLLPLFDAVSVENEDGLHEETEIMGFSQGPLPNLINEQKKLAIAEEVDNVYERLQALEADTEFLKHCISSLKRGDKGMDLLQEILQHLRDLRSVELRVRNAGDAFASFSA